jgi:DNA-binding transcriptional LysR family regulator
MELHQLRYLVAVAEQASFTKAAGACAVSQPSLSIQLKKLEDELGGPLFERGRKAARLTGRGQAFLPRAQEALQALALGRRELDDLAGLKRGQVTLGCMPTTGAVLLPPVLKAFARRHPGITVRLREESSPALAELLLKGEADLAIFDEAGLRPGLEGATLFKEELYLALPPGHQLAGKQGLRLRQVAEEGVILLKRGHGFRQIVERAFEREGLRPKVVFESGEIQVVQALVASGLGISLVPAMLRELGPAKAAPAYARLAAPAPQRTLSLAWRQRAPLSAAALALRQTCLKALAKEAL